MIFPDGQPSLLNILAEIQKLEKEEFMSSPSVHESESSAANETPPQEAIADEADQTDGATISSVSSSTTEASSGYESVRPKVSSLPRPVTKTPKSRPAMRPVVDERVASLLTEGNNRCYKCA